MLEPPGGHRGGAPRRVGGARRLHGQGRSDRLGERFGRVTTEPVAPGWVDEEAFQAGRGRHALDRATWERPAAGLEPVVIDPGRAFGDRRASHDPPLRRTAPRARTRQRARHRLRLRRAGDCRRQARVRAGLRGGLDPAGVEAAMRNAEANGVELEVRLLDATAEGMPTAEIALANLDLPTLAQLSTPSARTLVTSGYYGATVRPSPTSRTRLAEPRAAGPPICSDGSSIRCRWQRSRSASSAARCRTRMRTIREALLRDGHAEEDAAEIAVVNTAV